MAFLRRHPSSLGWRIAAAKVGALPAQYALIDGADDLLLWAAPNSEALALLRRRRRQTELASAREGTGFAKRLPPCWQNPRTRVWISRKHSPRLALAALAEEIRFKALAVTVQPQRAPGLIAISRRGNDRPWRA